MGTLSDTPWITTTKAINAQIRRQLYPEIESAEDEKLQDKPEAWLLPLQQAPFSPYEKKKAPY